MKHKNINKQNPTVKTAVSTKNNSVAVSRKRVSGGPAVTTIKRRAQRILNALGCIECELSIVLGNDDFVRQLNREYRNKDSTTDVLSFPMIDVQIEAPTAVLLGDVVISMDTATKQAKALGGSLLEEVTSLLIHGILHLLGYTHDTEPNEKRMNSKAIELLKMF